MYTVGEVAKFAGVTVRALHHYDALGVVSPSARSTTGYRLYSIDDLAPLQQVLFYKELGFSLERIRELMSDPARDRRSALEDQRAKVEDHLGRLRAVLDLIDRTLDAIEKGVEMQPKELFEIFGDFDPSQYTEEVARRWGHTDAYRESARRTGRYTKGDWERIRDENAAVTARMLAAFDRDIAPTDPEAMDVAEAARRAIDRAFYTCSHAMHEALAEGYVSDPRFRSYYDKQREGLAEWFAAAIRANAARAASEE